MTSFSPPKEPGRALREHSHAWISHFGPDGHPAASDGGGDDAGNEQFDSESREDNNNNNNNGRQWNVQNIFGIDLG
jgi:hypothetical protein